MIDKEFEGETNGEASIELPESIDKKSKPNLKILNCVSLVSFILFSMVALSCI